MPKQNNTDFYKLCEIIKTWNKDNKEFETLIGNGYTDKEYEIWVGGFIKFICIDYVQAFARVLGLNIRLLDREKLNNVYNIVLGMTLKHTGITVGQFYQVIYKMLFDSSPKKYLFPINSMPFIHKIDCSNLIDKSVLVVKLLKKDQEIFEPQYSESYISCFEQIESDNPELQTDIWPDYNAEINKWKNTEYGTMLLLTKEYIYYALGLRYNIPNNLFWTVFIQNETAGRRMALNAFDEMTIDDAVAREIERYQHTEPTSITEFTTNLYCRAISELREKCGIEPIQLKIGFFDTLLWKLFNKEPNKVSF